MMVESRRRVEMTSRRIFDSTVLLDRTSSSFQRLSSFLRGGIDSARRIDSQ